MKLVLTCEHAGNKIPEEFVALFRGSKTALDSHRGYDPGAFDLFVSLSELADFAAHQQVTRLLVEMNRSLNHPELFSEFTQPLTSEAKEGILKSYYFPFRNQVEKAIISYLKVGEEVLHLSVHTFTPVFHGETRDADIGILFDPARQKESETAAKLKKILQQSQQNIKVKFNYPYLGTADGFTTYLRKKFRHNYRGIELEINQKHVFQNKMDPNLKKIIFNAISGL